MGIKKFLKENKVPLAVISLIFFSGIVMFLYSLQLNASISPRINYQGRLLDANGVPVTDGVYDMKFQFFSTIAGGSPVWTETRDTTLWTETGSTTIATPGGCGTGFTEITYATNTNESTLAVGQNLWNTTTKDVSIINSVNTTGNVICISSPTSAWSNGDYLTNRTYVKNGLFSVNLGSVASLASVNFNQDLYLETQVYKDSSWEVLKPRVRIASSPNAMALGGYSWESPGPIGSVTPNTGKFSSLEVTNTAPEFRITSTGNSEYSRITRSESANQMAIYNRVTQPASVDTQTVTLMHFNGTDNSTSFPDSSSYTKTTGAVGDAKIKTAQSKFGGASGYFDGNLDNVTISSSSDPDFDFGSGDFTIDFWFRTDTVSAGNYDMISARTTLYSPFMIQRQADRISFAASLTGTSWSLNINTGTGSIAVDTWYHIAAVRYGNSWNLYLNGQLKATANLSGTVMAMAVGPRVGGGYGGLYYQGYLDELRFTKGLARWTTGFTPQSSEYGSGNNDEMNVLSASDGISSEEKGSVVLGDSLGRSTIEGKSIRFKISSVERMQIDSTGKVGIGTSSPAALLHISGVAPEFRITDSDNNEYLRLTKSNTSNEATQYNRLGVISGVDSNTSLLLHMDGVNASTTFTDNSSYSNSIGVAGNAQISTSHSKFGGSGALFDGSGDYIYNTTNSSVFAFGTDDFTVDFWMYRTAAGSTAETLFDMRPSSVNGSYSSLSLSSSNLIYAVNNSTVITGSTSLLASTWYHVALVRASGNTKLFLNGTQEGSTWADTTNYLSAVSRPIMGASGYNSTLYYYVGFLDEFRVSKGVARWTTTFTPEVAAYGTSSTKEIRIWDSLESSVPDEEGIQTFGAAAGRTVLDGKTVRFAINSVEKIRLDNSGNLGIGTSSPAALLHLSGVDPEIRITDTGNGEYMRFIKSDTSDMAGAKNRAYKPGDSPYAMQFVAGSSQGALKNGVTGLPLTNASVSITFAVKITSHVLNQILLLYGNPGVTNRRFAITCTNATNGTYAVNANGVSASFGNLTAGTWYTLGLTYDGTNMKTFVNNNTQVDSQVPGTLSLGAGSNSVYIGAGNGIGYTNSTIDEFAIYSTALNSTELTRDLNSAASYYHTGSETGLGGLWHIDSGAGTTLTDSKGSNPLTTSNSPTWVTGLVAVPGSGAMNEADIWRSEDGVEANESVINTFGDISGRTVLNGKTLRFNIGSAEKMRVDYNGYVGIGTSIPGSLLHIDADGTNTAVQTSTRAFNITGNTNDTATVALEVKNANSGNAAAAVGYFRANTAIGFVSAASSTNTLPNMQNRVMFMTTAGAGITIGTRMASSDIKFVINDSAKMILDSSGNLGVGVVAPASTLQVGTSLDSTLNYFQLDTLNDDTAGPPASTDCDASTEVGRMIVSTRYSATSEYAIWVCTKTGASTFAWKYTTLN